MIEINCQKINEYLTSFLADENGKTRDKKDSNSNVSGSEICQILSSKVSLIGNNESQKANIKTNTIPNNVEEFHRRLKSFECGLWTCTAISPLLCATYGWKLIDKDILRCVTCKALVCTTLPLPNKIKAYTTFSSKLKEQLKTGHENWCQWPNKPSPPEYLHPPLHMTVYYSNYLVREASNLFTLGNRIPYVNYEDILRKLGLDIKEVSSFFSIQPELNQNHLTAAILVLCGWGCEGEEELKCSLCFRSIGLWNFLPLSEKGRYEELEKRKIEREERRKIMEEKKKERERRLLIKEEKLKAKLLEEKKVALAEMEAKEKALQVKLALEKISKLENSDLSNPSDDSEAEEEMGEDEENLLLNEDGVDELIIEEGGNNISEAGNTASHLIGTSSENNSVSDSNSSHLDMENPSTSKHGLQTEEPISIETREAMLGSAECERDIESGECSKSSNGNGSEEDLWLEAVGGYREEIEINMSKSVYSPSSEESENSIDYPTDNFNRKKHRSESSEENSIDYPTDNTDRKRHSSKENSIDYPSDNRKRRGSESSEENSIDYPTDNRKRRGSESSEENSMDYPTDNTNRKRHRNTSSEENSTDYPADLTDRNRHSSKENSLDYPTDNRKRRRSESSEENIDYPTDNTNRKRHRSESSEENSRDYPTDNTNRKRHRSESSEENSRDYPTDNKNRKRRRSESSADESIEEEIASKCRRVEDYENTSSCYSNQNPAGDVNESMLSPTEASNEDVVLPFESEDNIPEIDDDDEIDEEEIEEIEEDAEEISVLNKMRSSLFLPLEQHRHWCGWVVEHSSLYIDEIDTGVKGFKIIPPQISQLQPDIPDSNIVASEKYAGNVVGLRTVRGILESWELDQDEER